MNEPEEDKLYITGVSGMKQVHKDECERLENLWAGQFGSEYAARNPAFVEARAGFWKKIVERTKPKRVLEVGCGVGLNLSHLAGLIGRENVYGLDININALLQAQASSSALINLNYGQARDLPFKRNFFDLVFTCGLLIHQPEETLERVINGIVACARQYVLVMEYGAPSRIELQYRGQAGALWKDRYGVRVDLPIIESGRLGAADGFDDLDYWLMQK